MLGSGTAAEAATYLSGTAALVDFGRNGVSGIRWGRWSTGTAAITTHDGNETVNLQDASLHWIAGPVFEARPMLPTSGSINFALVGGTSPTDTLGHVGALGAGTLSADFTAQKVNLQLSLDVNGYNWFAAGSWCAHAQLRSLQRLVQHGAGGRACQWQRCIQWISSAGPLTPDQLNGAGVSYWLNTSQGALGSVSGVAAFVPGSMVPLSPPVVRRDVAYAEGGLSHRDLALARRRIHELISRPMRAATWCASRRRYWAPRTARLRWAFRTT